MKIAQVIGREIYDSRGLPTIQCEIILDDESSFTGSAANDTLNSKYEARELRDGGKRFWGKGVISAVKIINTVIAPILVGKEPCAPELDFLLLELDGSPDKSHFGANTLNAVSIALYKANAHMEQIPLYELIAYLTGSDSVTVPCPQITVFSGLNHNNLCAQEIMIAPAGSSTLREAMELCMVIMQEFNNLVAHHQRSTNLCSFENDKQILDLLLESITRSHSFDNGSCVIALNASASHRYAPAHNGGYQFSDKFFEKDELIGFYNELINEYPIYSIEDGMAEDDWQGWRLLNATVGDKIQLIGNDLFASQHDRIRQTLEKSIPLTIALKPSQLGTITETLNIIQLCKNNLLNVIIASRAGETEDCILADLSVGASAGQIKLGLISNGITIAQCNRLLTIEDTLLYS